MSWYIAPITGTGTEDDPYRADINADHSAFIPTDDKGIPIGSTALIEIADDSKLTAQQTKSLAIVTQDYVDFVFDAIADSGIAIK